MEPKDWWPRRKGGSQLSLLRQLLPGAGCMTAGSPNPNLSRCSASVYRDMVNRRVRSRDGGVGGIRAWSCFSVGSLDGRFGGWGKAAEERN
ncbi:hypothetical protein CONLIGDRAFT_143156 [Coniochaeta ligniaria NRRL 30616]|uniref:Uncharacterized protein n=1 Tax=Coniochaeta ligniaria NRRL 30616 TaxID=1408157 RepID=A0A1J7I6S8_9PEZI|nr:hypothetical protein CONLIGDRAFT_143156 [Coniochaeta ligniaria NRRL 30616]